jgi:hypothetical protein
LRGKPFAGTQCQEFSTVMNSSMNSIALQDRDPSTFGPLPMAPHSEGSTTSEGDSVPREETSESYSDDDEDQAAADAFDGVLESAVRALQDRWNGAIDHGKGLVTQNLSLLSAGQLLPPNVDTPIAPSLPMSSFNVGQPLAIALNPMQLQQLPPHLAAPAYAANGITQGAVGPHDEASRAAQAVAAVTSTRTPKASTAAAAAAAQAASQLMHAEAEAGSDARDSTGRPTNPGYQRKTWSAEEDAAIHSLIAQHGTRWRAIAPHLAGRSDDSVRNRWKRISEERGLKVHDAAPVAQHSATPTVKATPKQSASAGARSSWSRSEDQAIVNAVREFGPRWCSVATCLPQRTEQAVRNRWNRLQQRARVQARALSLRRSAAGSMGPPPAMERLEQQQQAACV